MNYLSLRIVSIMIRLAAITAAFFVVLLFVVGIDRQYQARINVRAINQQLNQQLESGSAQLEAATAQLEALLNQYGMYTDLDIYTPPSTVTPGTPEPIRSASEELMRSITLSNVRELLVGLIASLVVFGFGGMLRLLVDIAGSKGEVDYHAYIQQDSNLAPTAPKRLADFPPKPDFSRKPIPAPPGTYDERLRERTRR